MNYSFALGDNHEAPLQPMSPLKSGENKNEDCSIENYVEKENRDDEIRLKTDDDKVYSHEINENGTALMERIMQCRNIIESLKLELNQEKSRMEQDSKASHYLPPEPETHGETCNYQNPSDIYSACIDSKLTCDENLMEYEKQLQKYQNTLNMAQLEKKNAIRKQMLAKAFKLKLMEVENQCNIELLRVKQSLQCLEPLQMIASNWKSSTDSFTYDLTNFELIPRYPELNSLSLSDMSSIVDENESTLKRPV